MTDFTPPAPDAVAAVAALARGLPLLKVISQADKPLGKRALADATGIPKATISRLAATL